MSGFKTSVFQGVFEIILSDDALVSIEDETEVYRGYSRFKTDIYHCCIHFNENRSFDFADCCVKTRIFYSSYWYNQVRFVRTILEHI